MIKIKTFASEPQSHRVLLEFTHPTAEMVCIAGTFNDWRPEITQMIFVGDGRWLKNLSLPPGTYEYLMVVDGRWFPDPRAKLSVSNTFGSVNSILHVPKLVIVEGVECAPQDQEGPVEGNSHIAARAARQPRISVASMP